MTDEYEGSGGNKDRLVVQKYGLSFQVNEPLIGDSLVDALKDHQRRMNDYMARSMFDPANRPPPRPTVPAWRTRLATKLLRLVSWLDDDVIPYD